MCYGRHMTTKTNGAQIVIEAIVNAERSKKWTAEKAGMAYSTFTRKLNGGPEFTLGELARIAKVLGISPASLLPDEFKAAA